ncbi:MAG: hypothetical protein Tsb0013_11450 [Phycisphaerales bacterium]
MAGGREYSRTQKKIIDRYYEHRDTIMAQKLGEIVSELYLAQGKKAQTLWTRAEKALANLSANDARVKKILDERSLEGLAKLVNDLG